RAGLHGLYRLQRLDLTRAHDWRHRVAGPAASPAKRQPGLVVLVARWNQPGDNPAALGDGDRLAAIADAIDEGETLRLELGGRKGQLRHMTSLSDQLLEVNGRRTCSTERQSEKG